MQLPTGRQQAVQAGRDVQLWGSHSCFYTLYSSPPGPWPGWALPFCTLVGSENHKILSPFIPLLYLWSFCSTAEALQ